MRKENKIAVIEQLGSTIGEYAHFYLVNIAGLNAEKTSQLRAECHKQDIKLVVVKNTLLKKALENVEGDFSSLDECLVGNTAVMFTNVASLPAKLIKTTGKATGIPQLKAAYAQESFYIGAEHLDALVNIKSKEELIGEVIMLLQSPAKNVISALQSGGQTIHGVLETLSKK
ncbi:50S ribosomal protein L10 [Bacteroidales bacterium]|nr:50S ribosomal protein L10 [Bacteroidales bacterium]